MVDLTPSRGVPDREYPYDWNRILSGVLAVAWISLSTIAAGLRGFLMSVLQLALPLACIWFPDVLGSMASSLPGPLSNVPIRQASPGCAVRFMGWVVLLTLTVGRIIIFGLMAP